jgi:predicted O-methyltransferase YrrM
MITAVYDNIEATLVALFDDAKYDRIRIIKGLAKSRIKPIQPIDFKHAYLSISKEQGVDLVKLIQENNLKSIVEFGTSFGISTLFLAQGILKTGGSIITTELIASKATKAIENFKKAGVDTLIDLRIGNAIDTLKNHNKQVDFLLLDGWKDLYLPVFEILEPNFHKGTIVYVDNAEMAGTQSFLKTVAQTNKYYLESKNQGKVVLIHQN